MAFIVEIVAVIGGDAFRGNGSSPAGAAVIIVKLSEISIGSVFGVDKRIGLALLGSFQNGRLAFFLITAREFLILLGNRFTFWLCGFLGKFFRLGLCDLFGNCFNLGLSDLFGNCFNLGLCGFLGNLFRFGLGFIYNQIVRKLSENIFIGFVSLKQNVFDAVVSGILLGLGFGNGNRLL